MVYSYVAQAYTDDVEKVIALMEGVMGIGFTMGPVIGKFIDTALGFSWTYFSVGSTLAPSALLVICLKKPKKATDKGDDQSKELV